MFFFLLYISKEIITRKKNNHRNFFISIVFSLTMFICIPYFLNREIEQPISNG
jgi:hypothetical protein